MPRCNLDINTIIGFQVESTAEWRRQKADQFPNDQRNLEAAEELERLAAEIDRLEGSEIYQRIDELSSLSGEVEGGFYEELSESVSAELRNIGFHSSYDSGATFLEWYRRISKHCCAITSTVMSRPLNLLIWRTKSNTSCREGC